MLRNILVWHKPNCLPQSVKDRFTVDYEPIFFFVKNKKYYFEQQFEKTVVPIEKIKERFGKMNPDRKTFYGAGQGLIKYQSFCYAQGRNKRCVWSIATQPYPEAHFAIFPEALVEPMIRAGCPIGGVVLDPFCGRGTTMRVAERLGRIGIGFDLGYLDLQKKYLRGIQKELCFLE